MQKKACKTVVALLVAAQIAGCSTAPTNTGNVIPAHTSAEHIERGRMSNFEVCNAVAELTLGSPQHVEALRAYNNRELSAAKCADIRETYGAGLRATYAARAAAPSSNESPAAPLPSPREEAPSSGNAGKVLLGAIAAIAVGVLLGKAIGRGGGGFAPAPIPKAATSDYEWDWDEFRDGGGHLVWLCRGVQTGQFAEDARCLGRAKIDFRWPGHFFR